MLAGNHTLLLEARRMSRVGIPESFAGASVFLLGGIVLLLLFAKVLLIPLAFALTLSFLLVPAVALLEKRGVRRTLAVALTSALTCICLVSGTYILSRQVLNVAKTLPGYRANIQKKIEALHSSSEGSLQAAAATLEDMSGDLALSPAPAQGDAVQVRLVSQRSDQLRATVKLIGSILEPIGQIGIVIIFTIYMLMNREDLRHRLLLIAGMGNLNVMTRALGDATARISKYLVMQFQVNACYGLAFGVGLFFLHVPEATLWGVIAGTLRIVPFVGPLMGMIMPLVLSIAISSNWWQPLLVAILFLLLEMTVSNVVEPWLFSSRTGISSLALLSSAIFWSMLWGWPGLVLSTPLTVCVVVVGRYVPQFSFLHSMLGTGAELPPAAHLYERLLALDQTEAWSIAERFLDGKPLVTLYDSVILPVLGLAEEDRHKGALSDIQSRFVLLSMGELVARLTEYSPKAPADEEKSTRSMLIEARRARLQKEFAVVCLSTGNKADELAAMMLAQLLERGGHQTLTLADDAVSSEILQGLSAEKDTVIVISALPPFAFAQSLALSHRVRAHLPDNRIAVALWNSPEDSEEMLARFGSVRPDTVVGTLRQALAQVDIWQHATRKC
jgi:predicted PurR-regulated permease PerM